MLFLLRSIQLVDQGVSVATYLRQNVVQAVKTGDNVYRECSVVCTNVQKNLYVCVLPHSIILTGVKITEDTALQDNAKIELQ